MTANTNKDNAAANPAADAASIGENGQFAFQAEVSRLLSIVTNALYSNRDIFLRELISNASDACDKLRYMAIAEPSLVGGDAQYRIDVAYDTTARTVTVTDNGIGMDKQDLIDNLGTIARSGTARLMEQVKAAAPQAQAAKNPESAALSLIGQFGVGFYASFMVANTVDVVTQKAGTENAYLWSSDGVSGFTIAEAGAEDRAKLQNGRGTVIILHIKDDASDYLIPDKLSQIITQYSDHVALPVYLRSNAPDAKPERDDEDAPVNAGSALWTRQKSTLKDEDYNNFYSTLTFGMDTPSLTLHWTAEGKIEYTGLLFVPTMRPFDMFDPSRRHAVRLYVRRVFITDQCENLVFPWLRFLRGVIDCQDLQLNISREMLQHNPLIHAIRRGVARKVLSELLKLSRDDIPAYATFWGQFGMILKEGLYDAIDHREDLFKLARFYSSAKDGLVSLEDYVARMKDGQEKIYYITGENADALRKSPQIEGYKSRGIEVLLMTDTIDSFWLPQAGDFEGKRFQSVTKGFEDLSRFDADKKTDNQADKPDNADKSDKGADKAKTDTAPLIAVLTEVLKDEVDAVRISSRLTESPVCLVAADHGVDMHMENVLKIQQHYTPTAKRVLEINAGHALIKGLAAQISAATPQIGREDAAWLLYDQAKILQGEKLADPAAFAARLTTLMSALMNTDLKKN